MSPRKIDRTRRDAVDWVDRAMAFYNAGGKEIALAEFMNPKGQFVEDEMYLFVMDSKGVMLAHGANEKFVGKQFIDLKDSDGKLFIKEIVDIANSKGSGWVEYKWYQPVAKQILPKAVYFDKVDDVIICSGVYKE
jgi:cytochrome c